MISRLFFLMSSWARIESADHIGRMICGQAEVTDFHMVLRIQEDVDRLQVPVNHALKETKNE